MAEERGVSELARGVVARAGCLRDEGMTGAPPCLSLPLSCARRQAAALHRERPTLVLQMTSCNAFPILPQDRTSELSLNVLSDPPARDLMPCIPAPSAFLARPHPSRGRRCLAERVKKIGVVVL